jgi:hypothetical protein
MAACGDGSHSKQSLTIYDLVVYIHRSAMRWIAATVYTGFLNSQIAAMTAAKAMWFAPAFSAVSASSASTRDLWPISPSPLPSSTASWLSPGGACGSVSGGSFVVNSDGACGVNSVSPCGIKADGVCGVNSGGAYEINVGSPSGVNTGGPPNSGYVGKASMLVVTSGWS